MNERVRSHTHTNIRSSCKHPKMVRQQQQQWHLPKGKSDMATDIKNGTHNKSNICNVLTLQSKCLIY